MKTKTPKRLRLSKETLRKCALVDLHRVAGGTGTVCYQTLYTCAGCPMVTNTCQTCQEPLPGSNGTNCRGCMQ